MSRHPFDPAELGDGDDRVPAEELLAIARELEDLARAESPVPAAAFPARVSAAISAEATPTPPRTFLMAVGALRFGDAWRALGANARVVAGSGRVVPVGLRFQAAALLLALAVITVGGAGVVTVGSAALVQALRTPPQPAPTLTIAPSLPPASVAPSGPTRSPSASESPEASGSPEPSESAEPGETESNLETADPQDSERPEASADAHGGSDGSGDGGAGSGSSGGSGRTPRPSGTPGASDDGHGND
ncbi:MAG: hypothetical protein ACXWQ6_10320 [Candidatus Limnocylindrales bacterium]